VTTLRLQAMTERAFDLALEAPRFVLWRHGGAARLVLDDAFADRVRRALSYGGVRTTECDDARPDPVALVRAVGTAIVPARLGADDLDMLDVTRLGLADATAAVLRRPIPRWPLGSGRRARCRALLRDADALFEIRRIAWCDRATLRSAGHVLRPVIFDRGAVPRIIRAYASDGALSRWIVG
jgi:hypothetical protein